MNIQEAKEQIRNAMEAYFSKNEFGEYEMPLEKQRPVFLMGPPGIGKTAIMEQLAREMDVALVSYSMTHHTRQSALGLPFITRKTYGGQEYDVSEYTMSEIIASIYDAMEATGKREGILFLDEINCVSETLTPVMLQFLQYKVFGRHRVPEGWIVVTAGNPPEYNRSVREFDVVTWDRLKRIDVEPDYEVWKAYAYETGVHPAVLAYLDLKKGDFYRVEGSADGKSFVTARGWSDLSGMLRLYEKKGLRPDEKLTGQYLQDRRIAREFAVFYDLFRKYRSDYQVDAILSGNAGADVKARARAARFDERLALLGLLTDALTGEMRLLADEEEAQQRLLSALRDIRAAMEETDAPADAVDEQIRLLEDALRLDRAAPGSSAEGRRGAHLAAAFLSEQVAALRRDGPENPDAGFRQLKAAFDRRGKDLRRRAAEIGGKLSRLFSFCEETFGRGQELLILVTELTVNPHAARFIRRYGCPEYAAHSQSLMFHERRREIDDALSALDEAP